MKSVGYIRVSTEEQATKGLSLQTQRDKILQYAKLYDIEDMEIVEDAGFSSKNLDRPGIQDIIEMIKHKEIKSIIITKLDRLTRNMKDLIYFIEIVVKKDVALVSISESLDTSSAIGRGIINIMGSIAQIEREQIGERTKAVLDYKRKSGFVYGRLPLYGYAKKDGKLEALPGEQTIIGHILQLKQTMSLAEICRELEDLGMLTRKGSRHWHPKVVSFILKDESKRQEINLAIGFDAEFYSKGIEFSSGREETY